MWFPDVGLPVRIGGERGRCAECESRFHIWELLRVEKNPRLRPSIKYSSVIDTPLSRSMAIVYFRPAHLVAFINASQAIHELFERAQ